MKPPLSDELRVRHVLDSIREVESYLLDVSLDEFLANSEKRFATIKQIEIIGNISIHEYFGVNFQIVWQIAQNDLPTLKQQFTSILDGFISG
jgi:uncharacterized protein with HEPN domain